MLRKLRHLVVLGLLMEAHPSSAQTWNALPALPEARYGVSAAALNGRVVVLGGFSTSQPLASATAWDPATRTWNPAAPMSQSRLFGAAASNGVSLFALGGYGPDGLPAANAERLDAGSGNWNAIAPLPAPRASFGAAWSGNAVVIAGGQGADNSLVAECFRYDPAGNSWSALPPLPTPRAGVAVAALDGAVWVIGGMTSQPVATVERLGVGGQWSAAPSLPEPLWFPAAAEFQGRIWVAGGMDASFLSSPRVYSAGPDGVWRAEESLPAPTATGGLATTSSCLLAVGGLDASGLPSAAGYELCVEAPPPADTLEVTIAVTPSILQPLSQGQWIGAHIGLPGGNAADIVPASLQLAGVPPDLNAPWFADSAALDVKFPRLAFQGLTSGSNLLPLRGVLADGRPFRGEAHLMVMGSLLQGNGRKQALRAMSQAEGGGIVVHLDRAEAVRLEVIDLQGRRVEMLFDGVLPAGDHHHQWPVAGRATSRGAYFLKLRRESGTEAVRLSVTR